MPNAPAESQGRVFLNRDQIVLAALQQTRLVLTTTIGTRVEVSGSTETLRELTDELVNAIGSNYLAIPDSAQVAWQHAMSPEKKRHFVDEGLEFITITK
jgi:hypothetical protein